YYQAFMIPLKKKKTIVKKLLPSLHDSIEEKENNCEKAITKPSQFN
ncbi:28965_t:CDS:1, partial [Gigaspora margarita]